MKKRVFREYICIVFLFFVSGLILFKIKHIWPFGSRTVIWADMTNSIPLFYYLYDALKGTDSLFFSWRYGCGLETLGIVSQQGMLSPVNLLLLLFERDNIYGGIGILLIAKMALMSGSMYFYLSKYEVMKIWKVVGAIAYATGMSVLVQQPIVMTLDIAILFPILIWTYEEGISRKKWFWYSACLAVCFVVNLYMSVMICLYIVIITGLKLLYMQEREGDEIEDLFFASLEGIAMSAIVWMPVLINYVNSSRLNIGIIDTYLSVLEKISLPKQIGLIFINLSSFIALIICGYKRVQYLGDKQIYYKKYAFVLLFIAVFIPPIEILWHMGSHSGWPWRFSYIFQFVVIDFAVALQQKQVEFNRSKRSQKIIFCITSIGILLFIVIYNQKINFVSVDKVVLVGSCILVGIYSLIYVKFNEKLKYVCFGSIFIFEILCNCYMWIGPEWQDEQDAVDMKYIFDATEIGNKVETSSTNRWIKTKDWNGNFASNYASIMNVNSIANWIHLVKKDYQNTFELLGYSTNYTRFLDNGGTIFSDLILGYKNSFSCGNINSYAWEKKASIDEFNWYAIKYDVPLIWRFTQRNNLKTENIFSYQNEFFKTLIGKDGDVLFREVNTKPLIDGEELTIRFEENGELYFWTEGNACSIRVNGQKMIIPNLTDLENTTYPCSFNNGIIDLGYYAKGEKCIIGIHFEDINNGYENIHMAIMNLSLFDKRLNERCNEVKYELQFSNNGVDVSISNSGVNEGEYLYFPILYDKGWKCYVNGTKQKTENLNGFLVIPMVEDDMNIQLRFYPKGMMLGIVFCILVQLFIVGEYALRLKYKRVRSIHIRCIIYLGIILCYIFLYIVPLVSFGYNIVLKWFNFIKDKRII